VNFLKYESDYLNEMAGADFNINPLTKSRTWLTRVLLVRRRTSLLTLHPFPEGNVCVRYSLQPGALPLCYEGLNSVTLSGVSNPSVY